MRDRLVELSAPPGGFAVALEVGGRELLRVDAPCRRRRRRARPVGPRRRARLRVESISWDTSVTLWSLRSSRRQSVACAPMSDDTKNDKDEKKARPRAACRRRDHCDVGSREEGDPVHGDGEVERPAQEGEARGGDLLRLLRRGRRRSRPPCDVRLQRRARSVVGVPAHGRRGSAARRLPVRRHVARDAPAPRRERVVVARVHRPRVRRPRRNRLQPRHRAREEGRRERRRSRRTRPIRRSTSATSATSSRSASSWAAGSPSTAAGARPCSSPARATAAIASVASRACSRRPRASA